MQANAARKDMIGIVTRNLAAIFLMKDYAINIQPSLKNNQNLSSIQVPNMQQGSNEETTKFFGRQHRKNRSINNYQKNLINFAQNQAINGAGDPQSDIH